jgi:hypothetical protein
MKEIILFGQIQREESLSEEYSKSRHWAWTAPLNGDGPQPKYFIFSI